VPTVNIDLTDFGEESTAPLVIPNRRIAVVRPTYAGASAPIGDRFLVDQLTLKSRQWTSVTQLSPLYWLTTADLSLGAGTIHFGSDQPASAIYLFGGWYPPDADGTWASGTTDVIAFDPAAALAGDDLRVTLTGVHFAAKSYPRSLQISVNGNTVNATTSIREEQVNLTFIVPRASIAANAGRVAIQIHTNDALSPSILGGTDPRHLVFEVTSLSVHPAAH
jgi:hypothetical protein